MVTILALAAAILYGSADFLGGAASRRSSTFAVLAISVPAGAVVTLVAGLITGLGGIGAVGVAWSAAAGAAGTIGLLVFYAGFAAAPMSVIAPVTALISTVLPVGVALVGGERPGLAVCAGAVICVVAVILVSLEQPRPGHPSVRRQRLRGLCYAVPAGVTFGCFFLFLREAGASGVAWPVTIARLAGAVIVLACCAVFRTRPLGPARRQLLGIALASGAVDSLANVCYVLATRSGLFGLAVVITSLYPGVTVLLARVLLGERMRSVQRAGLILAAIGVIMVTA